MNILALYFVRRAGKASALVWLALGTLIGLFEFLEEAGDEPFGRAAALALLGLPRLLMETLPFACAIGAAVGLALLEKRREIPAMRAAGMSPQTLARLSAMSAAPFCLALLVLSEAALVPGERAARTLRDPERALQAAARDLWVRDGSDFARIGAVSEDGTALSDVAVYRADGSELRALIVARSATHSGGEGGEGGEWRLYDGRELVLRSASAGRTSFESRVWDSSLTPSALSALTVRPREMSLLQLRRAAEETAETGQGGVGGSVFAAEFWGRLAALLALPLLSACGMFFAARRQAESAALLGAILAGGFFALTTAAERLSATAEIPEAALIPTLALAAGMGVALGRAN